jgi:hypothetical protein
MGLGGSRPAPPQLCVVLVTLQSLRSQWRTLVMQADGFEGHAKGPQATQGGLVAPVVPAHGRDAPGGWRGG